MSRSPRDVPERQNGASQAMARVEPGPLLTIHGVCKAYATPVLDGVELSVDGGEVHALVGSNGAGKTTLARIVAGMVHPDRGEMKLDGHSYAPDSKAHAEREGVQIVQQELNLIGTLSVAENLFLGRLPSRAGLIDRKRLREHAIHALSRVGLHELDPDTPAERLGLGFQQLVEIAAALAKRSRLLILDEPTAALTDPQVSILFENVRRLVEGGVGILYISHRLDELRRIADRATVLRDGKVVASQTMTHLTREEIVHAMAGREVEQASERRGRTPGLPALRVEGLSSSTVVRNVSFVVHRGEIFGLSGLIGAGRTSLLRAIFGAEPAVTGGVAIGPQGRIRRFRSPAEAARSGLALIPENRKRDGLLLPRSIRLNVVLGALGRWSQLTRGRDSALAERGADALDVKRASIRQPVSQLSGGNQQKVVVARWFLRNADVLLLDEPTRGIDVSARATLYRLFLELADAGKALILASSDLDELLAVCDRIGVMSAGRLVAVFERDACTREKLTDAAFGNRAS